MGSSGKGHTDTRSTQDRLGIIQALAVRLFLSFHFFFVLWRVTVSYRGEYWQLVAGIIPIVAEAAYILYKDKQGIEFKWFSPCYLFYMVATLPGIWLLEIHRTNTYQAANTTTLEEFSISGIEIPLRLSADAWVMVLEELMLYLMILGRWVMPRGNMRRLKLTALLFGLIGIASDIMELFALFNEDIIRHDIAMTYALLAVWSLSMLQFAFTFSAAYRASSLFWDEQDPHGPSSKYDYQAHSNPKANAENAKSQKTSASTSEAERQTIGVELVDTVLSLFMQDGPFLGMRLYCIVTYRLISYSMVFFTAKNVLVVLLLLYKIVVLCTKFGKNRVGSQPSPEEGQRRGEKQSNQFFTFQPSVYPH